MAEGGGLIVVHGANNSWGDWSEYNKMIAIDGWGDRNEKSEPFLYYDEEGKLHRDTTAGKAGSHGPQYEFVLDTRAPVGAREKVSGNASYEKVAFCVKKNQVQTIKNRI